MILTVLAVSFFLVGLGEEGDGQKSFPAPPSRSSSHRLKCLTPRQGRWRDREGEVPILSGPGPAFHRGNDGAAPPATDRDRAPAGNRGLDTIGGSDGRAGAGDGGGRERGEKLFQLR